MENIINYIVECIRPRNETEMYINNEFNIDIFNKLVQDGIIISNDKPPDYIRNIEYVLINNVYISKKCDKDIEWLNEDGTTNFVYNQEPIYRRLIPPPCETVNHTLLIYNIINYINNNNKSGTYIEYGVRCGRNLNAISKIVNISYGIDIEKKPEILNSEINYYKGYTDSFSENELPNIKFNFAFIDADHSFESVIKDFRNIYKYIEKDGIIFLHDTYPTSPEYILPTHCNDCYKTPIAIKKEFKDIEILTLPLNPGLTIIRKLV